MFRKTTLSTVPEQTSTKTRHDAFEFSPEKSKLSSPSRMSPKKKKTATIRKNPTKQTTPTKQTPKRSMFKSITLQKSTVDESYKRRLDEKLDEARKWQPLPTIFERKEANTLLDSIRNKQDIRKTMSTISDMGPENMRKMIRYATDSKNIKTLTPHQTTFLQELNIKIKTENPYTRMIHEETRDVADRKINWTSMPSPSLPRGVIVITHTHGGFVQSHNLIKYPTDVNEKLESVSTFYLSDIGSVVCGAAEDFKVFDDTFLKSFRREPSKKGISIKDISNKAQDSLKGAKIKNPKKRNNQSSILENYFESGVYNLAVSTNTNSIPFLNKNYSCGNTQSANTGMDILVVTDDGVIPLRDIIAGTFDCQNVKSSITTLQIVQELSKVIPDLEHVLIIDTSCSMFTPSIIKELFKEMPDESTPHKHRKTLFKDMSPSPKKSVWDVLDKKKTKQELQREERTRNLKTIKRELEPYFVKGLKGGKRTKKRHRIRRYNKNNNKSRKHTKTYYMRGGATTEQIAAAVVMRPLINKFGRPDIYKQLNEIVHHERKNASYYSSEEQSYTFKYSVLASRIIEEAYNIIRDNLLSTPGSANILHQVKTVMDKAAASGVASSAASGVASSAASGVASTASTASSASMLAKLLSLGSGTLGKGK